MSFIINPGTGPVGGATLEHAQANIRAFVEDLGIDGIDGIEIGEPSDEREGRWDFVLTLGERTTEVAMPGLPLERVRSPTLLTSPRLYVDGSSWWWSYALDMAGSKLTGEDD